MKHFILGGARSGKSQYAEQLAQASAKQVIYIATAAGADKEMAQRIQHHQQQRPEHWRLVEEQINLALVLQQNDRPGHCLLVDCLTLWLSNCLCLEDVAQVELQQSALLEVIPQLQCELILVSNEVGQGIVPMGELSRRFVDEAGRLHQRLSQLCDSVVFITAGLPQILK